MRRIIAGTLALTVLGSTWLMGAEGATKTTPAKKAPAKKAMVKKPVAKKKAVVVKAAPPMTVAAQLQQMKGQLSQQQQQINQLQQQLQQSNQQLQSAQQSLQAGVQKANRDASAAQQAASSAQQSANSLNSSVTDLKTTTATVSKGLAATQKDVKELLNPLAIRYKGITITPNGNLDLGIVWRDHANNADLSTPFSSTPLNGSYQTAYHEFRMSSRESQLGFMFQGNAGKAKLTGFWQIDFENQGLGSAYNQTNNFVPRVRHAWGRVQLDNGWTIMAGQAWTMGMINRKLIDQLTEWSPTVEDQSTFTGFAITHRQPQLRVTKNFWNNKAAVAFSVDNTDFTYSSSNTPYTLIQGLPASPGSASPSSQVTPFISATNSIANGGQAVTISSGAATPVAPDFWVKLATNPGWGHFEIKAVGRIFRDYVVPGAGTAAAGTFYGPAAGQALGTALTAATQNAGKSNYTYGGGVGFGMILPVTKKIDYIFNGLAGPGIGRYLNSVGTDVTLNENLKLVPIKALGATTGVEFHPMPKLDVNLYAGLEYYNRTQYALTTTAGPSTNATVGAVPIGYGNINYAPGVNNKSIKEVAASVVYRWYRGPYGTFQTMFQAEYWTRATWAGLKNTAANGTINAAVLPACAAQTASNGVNYGGDACTAKGSNMVGFISFRYILP